jgi:hypothetical protein
MALRSGPQVATRPGSRTRAEVRAPENRGAPVKWNPIDHYRKTQARRRIMPHAARSRMGLTAKVAIVLLVLILAAAAVLEWRGGSGADAALIEHARQEQADPVELVVAGARAHRLVFLADVAGAAAPKRFAVEAIEAIARGPGMDALALAVDADLQPVIDRYLDSNPEDASILMSRPRALREWDGAGRSYMEIYRTIWRLNQELGADRRIRIFAIDLAGWPFDDGRSPSQLARLFGQRDDHMAATIEERLLSRDQRARVVFFADALHTLKTGGANIQTGGTGVVEAQWLAGRMAQLYPGDVFSVLVDAPSGRPAGADVVVYRQTRLNDAIGRADGLPPRFGLRLHTPTLDDLIRPVHVTTGPGITADLTPASYRLRDVADAYVYLGG